MILLSSRRADILASVALHVAAKGGVRDKAAIADSWRRASDQCFIKLSVIAGIKPDLVLRGILVDELERRVQEES